MFEEAPHHRDHADPLRDAGHAGTQRADAAADHVHPDSCLRGAVQRTHHVRIGEAVQFHRDARLAAGTSMRRLIPDSLEQRGQ